DRHLTGRLVRGFDSDEVTDLADHSADRDRVLQHDDLVRAAQAEAPQRAVLLIRAADAALYLRDLELDRHDWSLLAAGRIRHRALALHEVRDVLAARLG